MSTKNEVEMVEGRVVIPMLNRDDYSLPSEKNRGKTCYTFLGEVTFSTISFTVTKSIDECYNFSKHIHNVTNIDAECQCYNFCKLIHAMMLQILRQAGEVGCAFAGAYLRVDVSFTVRRRL